MTAAWGWSGEQARDCTNRRAARPARRKGNTTSEGSREATLRTDFGVVEVERSQGGPARDEKRVNRGAQGIPYLTAGFLGATALVEPIAQREDGMRDVG